MTEDLDIMAFPMAVPMDVAMWQDGMGLRDWFASQAMTALITSKDLPVAFPAALAAQRAYAIAQAMLVERQKYEKKD